MVLGAVVNSEGEDVLERAYIVSNKDAVIRLSNGGNLKIMEGNAKTRLLDSVKLFIVINLVKIPRGDPALLYALLIKDRPKDTVIPLAEGLPVLESVIEVEKTVASSANKEEFPDQYFTDSPIEG